MKQIKIERRLGAFSVILMFHLRTVHGCYYWIVIFFSVNVPLLFVWFVANLCPFQTHLNTNNLQLTPV